MAARGSVAPGAVKHLNDCTQAEIFLSLLPRNAAPWKVSSGVLAPLRPPPAATDSYRPIVRFLLFCVVPKCPTLWCRSVRTLRHQIFLNFGAEVSKWHLGTGTGTEMSNGHFCPGPEVSGHFGTNFVVPKCLGAEVSCGRSVRFPTSHRLSEA